MQINKVSGVTIKEKINTVNNLLDNWDDIIKFWEDQLDKITYVDRISHENLEYKTNLTKRELDEILIYHGIKAIGKKAFRTLLKNFKFGNKLSGYEKAYHEIEEKFRTPKHKDYGNLLKEAVAKRGEKLRQ